MNEKDASQTSGIRGQKNRVREILSGSDPESAFVSVEKIPARKVINTLISLFCDPEPLVRWRAVDAAGYVVSRHADTDMESARVIMRRLMWMLNDESGGIGWGVPEAMGAIMARHKRLADEFISILFSYGSISCNFLEHPVLQRGVIWAMGEVARHRREIMEPVLPEMRRFLQEPDPWQRGYAARLAGAAGDRESLDLLEKLKEDESLIDLYEDGRLSAVTVGGISERAILQISNA